MNRDNNEFVIFAIVIGIVIFIVKIIATIVVLGVVAVTAFTTVIALGAWIRGDIILDGNLITRAEGRAFILRGIGSAFVAAILLGLYSTISGNQIAIPVWWVYLIGYAFGSIGGEIDKEITRVKAAENTAQVVLPPLPDQSDIPSMQPPVRQPFHFASWDDEDINQ